MLGHYLQAVWCGDTQAPDTFTNVKYLFFVGSSLDWEMSQDTEVCVHWCTKCSVVKKSANDATVFSVTYIVVVNNNPSNQNT